jgi:hypothetical protein
VTTRLAPALLSMGALAACPAPGEDATCTETPPAVELGNGETAHVALTGGEQVVMVHGPQGGWHVWLSLALTNLGPDVDVRITLVDLTRDEAMTELRYTLWIPAEEGCVAELAGLAGFLPYDDLDTPADETPPEWRACDTFRMCVDVVDADGRSAEDCAEVVAIPDPADGTVSC